jgi:hypothetical protein
MDTDARNGIQRAVLTRLKPYEFLWCSGQRAHRNWPPSPLVRRECHARIAIDCHSRTLRNWIWTAEHRRLPGRRPQRRHSWRNQREPGACVRLSAGNAPGFRTDMPGFFYLLSFATA